VLLAIDTSTRYAGVALADEQRVLTCRVWFSKMSHTTELMPAIAEILKSKGLSVAAVEGVAIALGPGGFSALRVGMSVAKGLAMIAKKPLVGVPTLDLEASPYLESGLPVCSLLDAGRGEVASAHFDAGGRRTREDLICSLEELLEPIAEQTLFCGEGMQSIAGVIKERLGSLAVLVGQSSTTSRLRSLAAMARQRLADNETDDLATLQPYYLRMPSIGGPKRRDWVPQRTD